MFKAKKAKTKKKPTKDRGIVVAKTPSDVFTAMLVLAVVALSIGCLILYSEIASYGGFGAVKGPL